MARKPEGAPTVEEIAQFSREQARRKVLEDKRDELLRSLQKNLDHGASWSWLDTYTKSDQLRAINYLLDKQVHRAYLPEEKES